MVTLEFVARFAGADVEADREVLEVCRDAAVEWYENAGVSRDTTGSLYAFWVGNLAAWFFDNRGNAEAQAAIPAYIVSSVHQLRYTDGDGE